MSRTESKIRKECKKIRFERDRVFYLTPHTVGVKTSLCEVRCKKYLEKDMQ